MAHTTQCGYVNAKLSDWTVHAITECHICWYRQRKNYKKHEKHYKNEKQQKNYGGLMTTN